MKIRQTPFKAIRELRKAIIATKFNWGNIAIEWCNHCENEVAMMWDCDKDGFKAFCPYCGKRLMLCSECISRRNYNCDFDFKTENCRFNEGQ